MAINESISKLKLQKNIFKGAKVIQVPVTGQPLPLISKDGTSSIINCIYIGMILSVSKTALKRGKAN